MLPTSRHLMAAKKETGRSQDPKNVKLSAPHQIVSSYDPITSSSLNQGFCECYPYIIFVKKNKRSVSNILQQACEGVKFHKTN